MCSGQESGCCGQWCDQDKSQIASVSNVIRTRVRLLWSVMWSGQESDSCGQTTGSLGMFWSEFGSVFGSDSVAVVSIVWCTSVWHGYSSADQNKKLFPTCTPTLTFPSLYSCSGLLMRSHAAEYTFFKYVIRVLQTQGQKHRRPHQWRVLFASRLEDRNIHDPINDEYCSPVDLWTETSTTPSMTSIVRQSTYGQRGLLLHISHRAK